MSVDGFVAKLEERLAILNKQISDIVKKDHGRRIYAHMRSQADEVKKINEAIYKAQRRGVRE